MIKKFRILIFILALFLLCSLNTQAQNKRSVQFATGSKSATVTGTVRGYEYIDFVVSGRAGQTVSAKLSAKGTIPVLTVLTPNGENIEGAIQAGEYTGQLRESGNYVIRVGMMRAAARRKKYVANFSLRVSVQ